MPINVSKHAYAQAKMRLGLKKKAFLRLAETAFEQGISHAETTGRLKKYVDKKYLTHRSANNIRIYGEFCYLFCHLTLVTIYIIPNDLKKATRRKKNV